MSSGQASRLEAILTAGQGSQQAVLDPQKWLGRIKKLGGGGSVEGAAASATPLVALVAGFRKLGVGEETYREI